MFSIFYLILSSRVLLNFYDKQIKFLIITIIFFLFFSKGLTQPFGTVFLLLYEHFPLFNIFKTPTEKFSVPLVFFISILLQTIVSKEYYLNNLKHTYLKFFSIIFLIPLILGFHLNGHNSLDIPVSRIYNNYDADLEVINFIDKNYKDAKVLSIPGHNNYQVWIEDTKFKRIYSGLDPVLHNLRNNNFIEKHLFPSIFELIKNKKYKNLYEEFEKYNIQLLYYNENYIYPFGSILNRTEFESLLNQDFIDEIFKIGKQKIFKININNNFNFINNNEINNQIIYQHIN